MPRKKIEFTEAQNFRIAQLVEINKTAEEIVDDLKRNFGMKVGVDTIKKQIDSLGLTRLDGRKWNGNHSRGYAAEVVSTKDKPMSTYKLKKLDCGCMCSKEQAKKMGYDKNGLPSNYRLVKDKTGEVVEVELLITIDNIKYSGGEGCAKGSERWWMIERMRFDFGCKDRGILKGQKKGDWRGIVHRFNYDENDYYRFDQFDIVKEQQEAWERYVDAAYDVINDMNDGKGGMSAGDIHTANKFIINSFTKEQLIELMNDAPEFIYKYIPSYLYGKVVGYCIDKMYDDNRTKSESLEVLNAIRNIMSNAKTSVNGNEVEKITLDVVKQCLFLNPNDYDLVIRYCCIYAINFGLISKEYSTALFNMLTKVSFKCVDTKDTLIGLDWLAVYGDHKDDFRNMFEKKEKDMERICEKYGLIW
jgi:hypothetical protein